MENLEFFLTLLKEHILISFTAIFIAIVVGIMIGIYISNYKKLAFIVMNVVNVLYTIPSIALLGFLISFTGIGNTTAIIALVIYGLLPVVRSTYTGIISIDPLIIEAAEGIGSTKMQLLKKIKFPLAFPIIMAGIRNMVTMTIALTGIASFVGAGGLGVAIYRGITTNNPKLTMMGSIIIALLAFLSDFLLGIFERYTKSSKFSLNRVVKVMGVLVLGVIIIFATKSFVGKKNEVHIATKPMTETILLGEMMKDLILDQTDLDVKVTHGVGGGTSNIHPGMMKKEFDIYSDYTGTIWQVILKKNEEYTEEKFPILAKEYREKFGMVWANLYGFNNTFGIAVRKEIADKYNLKTYSDLRDIAPNLIFGAEYDFFEREDGYKALVDTYDLHFKKKIDMDVALKYKAIQDKKIDVMIVFTTDGQISSSGVVLLQDDKNLYPSYLGGTIIREEVLNRYPELERVLKQLDHILTEEDMSYLNNEVENRNKKPEEVAKDFLIKKGLLGDKR